MSGHPSATLAARLVYIVIRITYTVLCRGVRIVCGPAGGHVITSIRAVNEPSRSFIELREGLY